MARTRGWDKKAERIFESWATNGHCKRLKCGAASHSIKSIVERKTKFEIESKFQQNKLTPLRRVNFSTNDQHLNRTNKHNSFVSFLLWLWHDWDTISALIYAAKRTVYDWRTSFVFMFRFFYGFSSSFSNLFLCRFWASFTHFALFSVGCCSFSPMLHFFRFFFLWLELLVSLISSKLRSHCRRFFFYAFNNYFLFVGVSIGHWPNATKEKGF